MSDDVKDGTAEASFKDLPSLKQGVFRWTVQPYFSKNGTILNEGEMTEGTFKIELPTLKAPSVEETGRLYGN